MSLIRHAELRVLQHVQGGDFGGLWHSGLGHEAIACGTAAALRGTDRLYATHRGLGHVVAKGMSLEAVFGDILVRRLGSARGKGAGTPHFADPAVGVMGFSGTLGGSFVLGAGSALAATILGRDEVTAVVFGDGASARGTFHEAALTASTWKLPVVWICENNQWGASAPFAVHCPTETIAERAGAYGMPGAVVDGADALAVHAAVRESVDRARDGGGPSLLELRTVRMHGHYAGDQQQYRDEKVQLDDPDRDPLPRMRSRVDAATADRLDRETAAEVQAAFDAILAAPTVGAEVIYEDVWV